ncbi:MAG: glycosyltransferase [Nocardioides sp.]|nr:glycosyltransferase [Nocardioides sp.]
MSAEATPGAPRVPRISVLTAVYDPPLDAFDDTAASMLAQGFTDWEWLLVDDRSPHPEVRERLRALAAADPRVTVHERETNGGIVAASNDALSRARGEFVALLDHDDVLTPDALQVMVDAIDDVVAEVDDVSDVKDAVPPERAPREVDYLYSDQDLMRRGGQTFDAFRKPDWSPERLRHHMYTGHFSVLRRSLVLEVGGFRAAYDGSQDHDLVLRVTERARAVVHVPRVLYHWRQVEGSAADDPHAKPYAWNAGVRAVQDHLDRVGIPARVEKGERPGRYVVHREPDLTTPVSVVIPTRGSRGLIWGSERIMVVEAVRSVRARSRHEQVEFVVVYDTDTPAAVLDALRALADSDRVDLTLVPYEPPFNFSEKCNLGALHARHDTLVFLNDDVEAESEGVLEQLIAPLREPGVGMTGPKLFFEDLHIQHAGVSYGSGTIAHMYHHAGPHNYGHHGELFMNREVTALTGACVAVRRSVFEEVGGFSEAFPMNYNDVDFSLKVGRLGLRRVWLAGCTLFHFESVTRSNVVHDEEKKRIVRRWGNYLVVRERYSSNVR